MLLLLACSDPTVGASHLEALGYVDGVEDPSSQSGVLHHERGRVQPGWNLYGSTNSNEAFLLDLDGELVHHWVTPPGLASHVELLPDGDLLVLTRHRGVSRLAPDGQARWTWEGRVHHDFDVDGDRLLVLTEPDGVATLSLEGQLLDTHDLSALLGSDLHSNHVEVLPDGRWLVSARDRDTLAILSDQGVDWSWGPGELHRQHHPTWQPDGTVLVFDNGVDRSRVVQVDPRTNAITWSWAGELFSETRGSAQRLANGNTLITESDPGYVHEVTTDGDIVWTWANPAREGTLRRAVWRMTRVVELPPALQ